MNEIDNRLKQLKIEDFIWIIYIGIIGFSLYSNTLERKYFVEKDEKAKDTYKTIMTGIFLILVFVYGYFLNDSFSDFKNLKEDDTDKYKKLVTLSFIASLLIFISGIIYLYISLNDENIDVELAFN